VNRHYRLSIAVDMIEFIGRTLLADQSLERTLVVFPGKRPGHFLRKYLADQRKTAYEPPAIMSVDEFIDAILGEPGLARRTVDAVDCLALLYRLNQDEQRRVIGSQTVSMVLDEFLPWGFKLFSDFEELMISDVPAERLGAVETLVAEGLPRGIRAKLTALAGLFTAFYGYLEKNDLVTRSLKYRLAADRIGEIKMPARDRMLFAGLYALTPVEKRIFSALARDPRSSFILQDGPGIEKIINDLRIDLQAAGEKGAEPQIRFHKAMDSHAEVFGLNQLVSGVKDLGERDVVVLPRAETLFPVINCTLGFVSEHNISMGYPVFRTPMSSLIAALSRLLESRQRLDPGADGEPEYESTDYLRLVLHPYIKNLFFEGASYPTRIIFHAVEEMLVSKNRRFVSLDSIEKDKEILNRCVTRLKNYGNGPIAKGKISDHLKSIHDALIRPFTKVKNIADCTEKLLEIISLVSGQSPAHEHAYTAPFVKTVIEGLYGLAVSDLGKEKLMSIEGYFHLIQGFLKKISHPFSGTPVRGLQVLGFLETRNIKFNRVFLLDANEGVLPRTAKEDTTLPYAVRKVLGLKTHEDQEKIFSYYFETLVKSAKTAHIFYVEAEDKEKSRFVERLIWDVQKRSKSLEYPAAEIFFPVDFVQPGLKPAVKSAQAAAFLASEGSLVYSASSLNDYLKCQLLYYYKKVLGIKEKEEISDEPDPMGIGNIVHDILFRFFVKWIGKPLGLGPEDHQAMDRAVDVVFKERYRDIDRGAVYLVRSQVKRRLRHLVDFHIKNRNVRGAKIMECENLTEDKEMPGKFRLKYAPLEISRGRAVILCGRLDRIDEREGSLWIVDYKTSAKAEMPNPGTFDLARRDEWSKTIKSVQLPLYIHLYAEEMDRVSRKPVRPGVMIPLIGINSGLMIIGSKEGINEQWLFSAGMDEKDRGLVYGNYKKAIIRLIEEILDPEHPFMPPPDDKPCLDCAYKTFCGRQHVVKTW
jgi:ATP-dependent helicase/nuclease subunit B